MVSISGSDNNTTLRTNLVAAKLNAMRELLDLLLAERHALHLAQQRQNRDARMSANHCHVNLFFVVVQ
jgi:hypothetical protein